jgi:glutathione S-transferase
MRARMAIAVSGLKVEIREVVLRDKPTELLEISPKATVPVLVDRERILDHALGASTK